jgi:hypothetical protein
VVATVDEAFVMRGAVLHDKYALTLNRYRYALFLVSAVTRIFSATMR